MRDFETYRLISDEIGVVLRRPRFFFIIALLLVYNNEERKIGISPGNELVNDVYNKWSQFFE